MVEAAGDGGGDDETSCVCDVRSSAGDSDVFPYVSRGLDIPCKKKLSSLKNSQNAGLLSPDLLFPAFQSFLVVAYLNCIQIFFFLKYISATSFR